MNEDRILTTSMEYEKIRYVDKLSMNQSIDSTSVSIVSACRLGKWS